MYYKLIDTDLSRQTNMNIPQQSKFVGKLDENYCGTMFFIAKKHKKNSKFYFKVINCNRMI